MKNTHKASWNFNTMPSEEEIQKTYENTGENLFLVCIENPHKRHATANKRPYIVREAILNFCMFTEKYSWLVGSDDGLNWIPTEVAAWQCLPECPSTLRKPVKN